MPKITLPNGDIKEFDKPISIYDLASVTASQVRLTVNYMMHVI